MAQNSIKSWKMYNKSLEYLASGTSTGSKRPSFENIEPGLIVKGKGCKVWDVDGNQYIDYRSGIGPVSLGYANSCVDNAISKQLKDGIVFGHPHPLEGEVAKILTENIPSAEKVRFLKTGGEAVAACIKISRAVTGRNKIIQCGYNGWLNTLSTGGFMPIGIANTQPLKGVPVQTASLHSYSPWGDIAPWEKAFDTFGKDIAAVVIASNYSEMEKGKKFLPALRKLTKQYGILMVMDEIVTGFRLAIGGAHQYFGFIPDLAVFGKGMANGMPITAFLGRKDLMDMAREVSVSSTFGGETLSLAAVKATIKFYKKNRVIDHLWEVGTLFQEGVNRLFKKYGISAELQGFPVCPVFSFEDNDVRADFFKNCYANGVSLYNVPYVTYAHKKKDIEETLKRIEKILQALAGRKF
jgi:glutamate-1-semialdehyde 2,1-aminomutase